MKREPWLDEAFAGLELPGAPADLVVVDDELEVIATVVGGQLAYSRGGDVAWK